MSWQAIARKDFMDASRSYLLWGLTAVFVLIVSVITAGLGYIAPNLTSTGVINPLHILFQYIIPLIAILISFGAVVDERTSGSLKVLLSLPHSRDDVIVGKMLGRSGAFVLPLVVGMALPALGMLAAGVTFEPLKYVGYILLASVFGLTYVALATGLSAALSSRFRVLLSLLGFYFVFNILWFIVNTASVVLILALSREWPAWMPLSVQETRRVFQLLSPTGDFQLLKQALFNDALYATQVPEGVASLGTQVTATLMLLAWIALPLAFGIVRFRAADL